MRRILFLVAVIFAVCMGMGSCANETPKFDLSLDAAVFDAGTYVTARIDASARNVAANVLCDSLNPAKSIAEAGKEGRKARKWLDRKVDKFVKDNVPDGADWSLHIKGYVKYYVTISIDETFPKKD